MSKRISLLTIFLTILVITSLAAGSPSRVHSQAEVVEIVVHDDETTAQRLGHEEWVEWLLQTGLQKEQVDLLVEYDRQIELAQQNGVSREDLERITIEPVKPVEIRGSM